MKRLPRAVWIALAVAAVVYAVVAAVRQVWWCDDAFISFRYAWNLDHGLGLVYNAGERVEGYSNFLWTIGLAVAMRLGLTPETASAVAGVVFYAATVALLCLVSRREEGLALPLAGWLAATHADWSRFATSGLETSAFTFLGLAAYVLANGPRGALASGAVAALAALTRPDGVVFAPVLFAFFLMTRRRDALVFAAVFLALWLPYVAWKIAYYGDFFPNTYYAKSAALPWYGQGWLYFRLYAQKYPVVVAGLPVALVAWALRRNAPPRVLLAGAMAIVTTLYVIRVGGDFMYARMLIPATPFFLILLEWGIAGLSRPAQLAVTLAAVAAMLLVPYPFAGKWGPGGIVNEPLFYPEDDRATQRRQGETLRRYFDRLPVRVVYIGSQARLVYYARPAVAIEGATGLTDRWIAHQRIAERGRIGHEKRAPMSYLLEREVDFTLGYVAADLLDLGSRVPLVRVRFDDVPGNIVRWHPAVLEEVARRGAAVPDFPRYLRGYVEAMDSWPDEQVRLDYARFRDFYLEPARDTTLDARFRARLTGRRASLDTDPRP